MKKTKQWIYSIAALLVILFGGGQLLSDSPDQQRTDEAAEQTTMQQEETTVVKGKTYSSKEDVAAYLHQFGELPPNYLTKKEAEQRGWDNAEGNLWEVTDHMSIGGDHFGNFEGLLPEKKGRTYSEADIDYDGGYRGAKRLIYSNDGLIFYTDDHYETFERLY